MTSTSAANTRRRSRPSVQAQHAATGGRLAVAGGDDGMKVLVAVATTGGGKVNQHFGHATEFQILRGHRKTDAGSSATAGGPTVRAVTARTSSCRPSSMPSTTAMRAGGPRSMPARGDELKAAGIEPVEEYAHEFIEKAACVVCRLPPARRGGRDRAPRARRRAHPPRRRDGGLPKPNRSSFQLISTQETIMAYKIIGSTCPGCSACDPVPQRSHPREERPSSSTRQIECIGHFDEPQCVAVCPIDGCIVKG